jgi:ABC-2 type transport system ATP-binding protein
LQGINQQHEQSRKPIVPDKTPPLSEMGEAIIEVRNLSKKLAALPLLTTFPLRSIKEKFWFSWGKWSRKTTAMKMLIGISTPTSGEAVVAGYNVKSATEMVKKSIGYGQKILHDDDL